MGRGLLWTMAQKRQGWRRARKTEDEGGVQDRAQGLCTCCFLHPGNSSSERFLRPTLAKADPG